MASLEELKEKWGIADLDDSDDDEEEGTSDNSFEQDSSSDGGRDSPAALGR